MPKQKSNSSNKIVAIYIPFVIGMWIYLDKTRIKKNRFILFFGLIILKQYNFYTYKSTNVST